MISKVFKGSSRLLYMFRTRSQMITQQNNNPAWRVGLTKSDQKAKWNTKIKIFNLKTRSIYLIELRDNGVINYNQANERLVKVCKGKANRKIALPVKPKGGWLLKNPIVNRHKSINGIQHSQSHSLWGVPAALISTSQRNKMSLINLMCKTHG